MSNSLETQLYRATVLTFEDLGFVIPSPDLQRKQKAAALEAAVSIGFHGPVQGDLVLAIGGGILPLMAANMLGEARVRPSVGLQQDALGELANVICGNVLPDIAGTESAFDLDPPRLLPAERVRRTAPPPNAEAHVGLGDGRADVYLFLHRERPGAP
jgi:CheY-specific phosphatase CheX